MTPSAPAAPQPNPISGECADGVSYTAFAPSQASSVARGTTQDGQQFTLSVKAADIVQLTGVPRELLTRCDVYIDGYYLIDGYVLLSGPGR